MGKTIDIETINNLPELFTKRIELTPDIVAYRYFDESSTAWRDLSWADMGKHVARWQAAFKNEGLSPGDRVALMIANSPFWVMFEQAALGLGLVVVPLYTNDRADNIAYIIEDAAIKVLFVQNDVQWLQLQDVCKELDCLKRIISQQQINADNEPRLMHYAQWLPDDKQTYPLANLNVHKTTLATIVYTSGTTGKPKGVMLSHGNIFWNAWAGTHSVMIKPQDIFLSFLPLSHMFERTVGYYIPMLHGCTVAYARSIEQLGEDLISVRPTVLITVPRIFERVYNKIKLGLEKKSPLAQKLFHHAVEIGWYAFRYKQGKESWHPKLLLNPLLYLLVGKKVMAKLGGHMRLSISGGAPLSLNVAKVFIGLGLTISQGYGMTEASPVVSTNKLHDNEPDSVGQALRDVEVRLDENGELLVRSPGIMLGYWNNDEASKDIIDADGWLHTGDKADIKNEHIYITGRIKEILVLSNGEKIPPADLEMAISSDPLFDQILVVGEQKPFLSCIAVLNPEQWKNLANFLGVDNSADNLNHTDVQATVLEHIRNQLSNFPGYAKIYSVHSTLTPWTIENNMLTPTMKLRRTQIIEHYAQAIKEMYKGH